MESSIAQSSTTAKQQVADIIVAINENANSSIKLIDELLQVISSSVKAIPPTDHKKIDKLKELREFYSKAKLIATTQSELTGQALYLLTDGKRPVS